MKKIIQNKLYEVSFHIENIIAVFLLLAIVAYMVRFIHFLPEIIIEKRTLNAFLGEAMTIAVGAEFMKMLCKHTPTTVIEVLLFAIARQMVITHISAFETLMGVVAIAGLFAIKKFLFCSFEEADARGSNRDIK